MNVRQLESFVSIVERGSFAAAAVKLFTTQSTISARIRELEKHLGVALFDRSHHRAKLTPKGEEMLPYARQMLQVSQQIDRRVGDPASIEGLLRIGAVGVVARTLLPGLLADVRRRYPNVRLKVRAHLARTLLEMLDEGGIDLALVTVPVAAADVEVLPIGHDDFVWAASPDLGMPMDAMRPHDLAKWPILGFPEESHHFPVVSRWFADNSAVYAPAIACNDMDVLADLAVEGAGVALLPRGCYGDLFERGRLRALSTAPGIPQVGFAAVYKRNALLHPLAHSVAELASEAGMRRNHR